MTTKSYHLVLRDDCPARGASEIKQLLKYLVKTLDLKKITGDALKYASTRPDLNELHEQFVEYYKGEL